MNRKVEEFDDQEISFLKACDELIDSNLSVFTIKGKIAKWKKCNKKVDLLVEYYCSLGKTSNENLSEFESDLKLLVKRIDEGLI